MKTISIKTLMSLAVIALFLSIEIAAQVGADWPQWRGPNRDGISKETGLLKQWPEAGPTAGLEGHWRRRWIFVVCDFQRASLHDGTERRPRIRDRIRRCNGKRSVGHTARHRVPQRSWRRPARYSHGRRRNALCPGRKWRSLSSQCADRQGHLDDERAAEVWR